LAASSRDPLTRNRGDLMVRIDAGSAAGFGWIRP
jgi:hypothetical protein